MATTIGARGAMLVVVSAAGLVACGGGGAPLEGNAQAAGAGGGGSAGSATSGGVGGAGLSVGAGGQGPSACSDASGKVIYVVTAGNGLRTFDPATLAFEEIGTMNCGSPIQSIAIGLDEFAYVGTFKDGGLYRVSTTDASCEPTTYSGHEGDVTHGLAFSSDTAQGASETLFSSLQFADASAMGEGLAEIALPTYQTTTIGDFTNGLAGRSCALTGTGDGRLFGLFHGVPQATGTVFAEMDKTSGATPDAVDMPSVPTSSLNASALAFWGGDIWFFTRAPSGTSQVTRYGYSTDKSLTVAVADTGFIIAGAAVSTCAPLTEPK